MGANEAPTNLSDEEIALIEAWGENAIIRVPAGMTQSHGLLRNFLEAFFAIAIVGCANPVACSPAPSQAQAPRTHLSVTDDSGLSRIVTDYVRHTRGWPDGSYTIQLNSHEGKLLVFWVLYGADNARTPGGDERSFEVVLNGETKRIERELHFQ